MEIILSKCILRSCKASDVVSIALHGNNLNIARNLRDIFPFPYTLKDAEFFINNIANSDARQLILAIEVEGEAAGTIGAHFMGDVYQKNVEVGYWLGEKYWGRGIVTEALDALVSYLFENYNIQRVFADVFETNIPSMRVLEKCGFVQEAIHRKAIFKNRVVMDEYVYAKLNPSNQ